jgi:hypothetical protein
VGETFAILVKFDADNDMYQFSPFSYLYPQLQLPPPLALGTYQARILVSSQNYRGAFGIEIHNKGGKLQDIEIIPNRGYTPPTGFKGIAWTNQT